MYEKKNPMEYANCPIRITLDIIAGSWKLWLIQEINNGIVRPSDIQRSIGIASKRVLNKQLRELEEVGIITKTIYPVIPLKVEYHLTDAGKGLLPIMEAMEQWGKEYKNTFLELRSKNKIIQK
ncbi:helix-turn-helix transcriptional regulator [Bacteroides pyogenes]|mgnify:CR=1 FL=1|jgi:DNA-binding HxlR family transcriptional regulator|uniref:winged helix-turn-helix transcriptional regulator n=2 Tax=Bacteroides pyogenes TaxID=310300 RepID=UPI0011E3D776|nr:helix-turn-helix domain-containing protein [Bacteroides pyogenes]MBR8709846.1 putative HTH-type transcriptional regulator YybR [Bacteroides pyogenes]MBR8718739.1 putative HTH-type transcriptional regulator YybR [Bacteroides pyogenes]MBR8748215.1 putative HTH-type transcriptional regulator YybR [Bacteroides pyogenes]MBR8758490.1 putative HTH-type transcriptional regulator YybR [Bacteroides pyogenes]MBR8781711.1 putative HTH-type transcriptional regulator YybR [Bacteroides pyogenes]